MALIRHYINVILQLYRGTYRYNKFVLFINYSSLVWSSILFHKLKRRSYKHNNISLKRRFLGFTIAFQSYAQLIDLVEEIFIYQVYNFYSLTTNTPAIVDCGSSIGISVLFFKKIYPQSTILAFEPDKEAFAMLQQNIKSNKLTDVLLYNYALTTTEGERTLFKSSQPGTLTMSLVPTHIQFLTTSTVLSKRLSDFITQPVDCLKIDVEGSETLIIDDLIKHNKLRYINQLIIEYHPDLTSIAIDQLITELQSHHITCTLSSDQLHRNATEVMLSGSRSD